MKSIYISRSESKKSKKWIFFALIFLALLFLMIRMISPFLLRSYINQTGADDKGYAYRVGDLDFNAFKGEIFVKDVKVFHQTSEFSIADMNNVKMNLDWSEIFQGNKIYSIQSDEINLTLSKEFVEEINRVKNEARKKIKQDIYLDRVVAKIKRFNLKEAKDDNVRTILSLQDVEVLLKDFGLGSINELTEFSLKSQILEGGTVNITGKTKLEADSTPWIITGKMANITSSVIEKMAGDKIPLDITKANLNAVIVAESSDGKIQGEISSELEAFKLNEEKKQGLIKAGIAKAANLMFKNKKEDNKSVTLSFPFILNENFTLNFSETLKMLNEQK